jgi:hypothetical protein
MVLATPTVMLLITLFICAGIQTVNAAGNHSQLINLGTVIPDNSRALGIHPELSDNVPFEIVFIDPVLNMLVHESVENAAAGTLKRRAPGTINATICSFGGLTE